MSNTSQFSIRPATLRDAKAIAELSISASQAACQGLNSAPQASDPTADQGPAYWRTAIEFNEPQVYVATQAENVLGFVGFDRSRDKGTPPTVGEIWAIYVTSSHWGQGIGLALWDTAREGLMEEGCTKVTLWLPVACERALRFHQLAGFKREMNSIKTVPRGAVKLEVIRLSRSLN
jgi:ribosomal protein S18 acetylase RimI-like enzyme